MDEEREKVIFEIEDFIGNRVLCPWIRKRTEKEFKRRSYYIFAGEELIRRIEFETMNPKTIVENFLVEMDVEYENSRSEERRFVFSCMRDCAADILFLL